MGDYRMRKHLMAGVALAAMVNLSACQTMDQEDAQLMGSIVGGIGGALLGSQIGDGAGQIVAVAIGTLAGAMLGSWLADHLTEQEQAAVAVKSGQALDGAQDGETVSWTAPDSGTEVEMTPRDTRKTTKKMTIVRERGVAAPPPIEVLGETWVATTGARLRAAPTTDSETIGGLKDGERFQAIAQVVDQPWIMVGRNNRTVGYVHASLVEVAPTEVAAVTADAVADDTVAVTDSRQGLTTSRDLDAMLADPKTPASAADSQEDGAPAKQDGQDDQQVASVDLDSMNLVAEEVEVTTTCRTLDVNATKDGESGGNTVQACRAQDGMWEIL